MVETPQEGHGQASRTDGQSQVEDEGSMEEVDKEYNMEQVEEERAAEQVKVVKTHQTDTASLPRLSNKLLFLFAFTCFAVIGNLYYAQPLLVLMGYVLNLRILHLQPLFATSFFILLSIVFTELQLGMSFTKAILKWA